MAVILNQRAYFINDNITFAPKAGVNFKITNDGGVTFFPSAAGIDSDAQSIALISVPSTGTWDTYVNGSLSTDFQKETIINLDNNLIQCTETDGVFGATEINTGVPSVGNDGIKLTENQGMTTYMAGTSSVTHIKFVNNNGSVGVINTSGTSTAYVTSSDPRLKGDFRKPSREETLDKFKRIEETFGIFPFLVEPDKETTSLE